VSNLNKNANAIYCTVRRVDSLVKLKKKSVTRQLSPFSDSLRAGWSGVRIPAGTWDFSSPKVSKRAPGLTHPPYQWVLGIFPGSKAARAWNFIFRLHLVPPLYAFEAFTGATLHLPYVRYIIISEFDTPGLRTDVTRRWAQTQDPIFMFLLESTVL
jgi:hypothetical protein